MPSALKPTAIGEERPVRTAKREEHRVASEHLRNVPELRRLFFSGVASRLHVVKTAR